MTGRSRLVGSEVPRIYTPPLRPLTARTSLGFAAVEFAEDVCEVTLYPWQKWLLIHALELHPDGGFRFRTIVVLVARQQGKSMLSVILSLFFMYVLRRELVIGTAQDLDVAEEIWQEAIDLIEETPDLNALKEKVVRVNGKKSLELKTGERYKVKAANRRAGRGLSGELILLDELREHQSFDSWGAITKTTIARPDAQVWALSNAGDATSVVLRYLRKKAHEAIGDPDGFAAEGLLADEAEGDDLDEADDATLGIFEWSARPGAETKDRQAWADANPALGHGLVTERTLASAEATDPEWVFRTECLCQWSDGSLVGPYPPGVWEAGVDRESKIRKKSDLVFGLDVSKEFTRAYIAVAGWRKDGIPHVELVAAADRTNWVVDWFEKRLKSGEYPNGMKVVIQGRGAPVSSLADELGAIKGLDLLFWQGSELGIGTGAFYNAVCLPEGGGLRHLPSPPLDLAAATADTKPSGDSWLWDRNKSATDIAPLIAANAAYWGLNQRVEPVIVSAYERNAVEVI
jgi:hypothetical protein